MNVKLVDEYGSIRWVFMQELLFKAKETKRIKLILQKQTDNVMLKKG